MNTTRRSVYKQFNLASISSLTLTSEQRRNLGRYPSLIFMVLNFWTRSQDHVVKKGICFLYIILINSTTVVFLCIFYFIEVDQFIREEFLIFSGLI